MALTSATRGDHLARELRGEANWDALIPCAVRGSAAPEGAQESRCSRCEARPRGDSALVQTGQEPALLQTLLCICVLQMKRFFLHHQPNSHTCSFDSKTLMQNFISIMM